MGNCLAQSALSSIKSKLNNTKAKMAVKIITNNALLIFNICPALSNSSAALPPTTCGYLRFIVL